MGAQDFERRMRELGEQEKQDLMRWGVPPGMKTVYPQGHGASTDQGHTLTLNVVPSEIEALKKKALHLVDRVDALNMLLLGGTDLGGPVQLTEPFPNGLLPGCTAQLHDLDQALEVLRVKIVRLEQACGVGNG